MRLPPPCTRHRALLPTLVLLATLAAGGTGLAVLTETTTLRTPSGDSIELCVDRRLHGWLEDEPPSVGLALAALVTEPLDLVQRPLVAFSAPARPDAHILGGPFGRIAAATPFATVTPTPIVPLGAAYEVDAALRGPDEERRRAAIRRLFPDHDVVRLWLP